ncbi:uncharacterized protein TNCV_1680951 [Trichonephila clavipes]|nr:uncharacterized protein TNCV_1680951 [Trichonephila clavipes]
MNLTWRKPPAHHWYAAKSPGLYTQCSSSRTHQMALARVRSGHLRSMTLVQGIIKDYKLFMVVGVLVMIDVIILTTWQIIDPFYRKTSLGAPLNRRPFRERECRLSSAEDFEGNGTGSQ